jgi:3-oxoacyl-[acyl-carrier-protein] synthase-3
MRRFDPEFPIGLTGLGASTPASERHNGDPVYAELEQDSRFAPLFFGYDRRGTLQGGSLAELMQSASVEALARANLEPENIGLLTGYASVSEYLSPNELFQLHRLLSLPESTPVVPVADEFTSFLSGVALAADRIRCGQLRAALVSVGCRWTENASYRDPVSASLSDGAATAVVERLDGSRRGLRLVADASLVPAGLYALMRLAPRAGDEPVTQQHAGLISRPLFNMLPESETLFREFGLEAPPRLARQILASCRVSLSDTTVIGHQATSLLLDAWRERLYPATLLDTLKSDGNMTLASIPFTLKRFAPQLQTRFVLLLGLGLGIHASACLLERH